MRGSTQTDDYLQKEQPSCIFRDIFLDFFFETSQIMRFKYVTPLFAFQIHYNSCNQ
jgi:hypothetical protein